MTALWAWLLIVWLAVALPVGWSFGRLMWRNGDRVAPPHHVGWSWFSAFSGGLGWPILAVVYGVALAADCMTPALRWLAERMWGE